MLLALLSMLTLAPAAVVVVWSPGYVDPYTPSYVPAPRPNYEWIPGWYDEYGYYVPGYWQPLQTYPGYIWAWGYWSGRNYHEGYWRPASQPGRAYIDGYYVGNRYVAPRWVREQDAEHIRAERHDHVQSREPSRAPPPEPHPASNPPRRSPPHNPPHSEHHDKKKK
jgi:hypothetical protein